LHALLHVGMHQYKRSTKPNDSHYAAEERGAFRRFHRHPPHC
jgi:hypothetical protein